MSEERCSQRTHHYSCAENYRTSAVIATEIGQQ
jgi:hypothetical protein